MSATGKEDLYSEFTPIDSKEWKDLIGKELSQSSSGPVLESNVPGAANYYSREDLPVNKQFGPLEKHVDKGNNWLIRENIKVKDAGEANKAAMMLLKQGGIDNLCFQVEAATDLHELLKGIYTDAIRIDWEITGNKTEFIDSLQRFLGEQQLAPAGLQGSISHDPVASLLTTGNWLQSKEEDLNSIQSLMDQLKNKGFDSFQGLQVSGDLYNAAGASITRELGCILAHASEYLACVNDKNLTAGELAGKMSFTVAVGTDYFLEIAKIRALRVLWKQLLAAYGTDAPPCFIHAVTSPWVMTIYDPYVNLLRTTTAAMSAVLGGCDSLYVLPFDAAFRPASRFSSRIARNIQHLIKEEAYLDKSIDPAAGSYYLETLTDQLAGEAWKIFREIESAGGLLAVLEIGKLQADILGDAHMRIEAVNKGEITALGVNKHPNASEKMKDQVVSLQESNASAHSAIVPLKFMRATAALEKQRLEQE